MINSVPVRAKVNPAILKTDALFRRSRITHRVHAVPCRQDQGDFPDYSQNHLHHRQCEAFSYEVTILGVISALTFRAPVLKYEKSNTGSSGSWEITAV